MRTLGYPTWSEVKQGASERALSAATRVARSTLSMRDALDIVGQLAERAVATELIETARIDDRADFNAVQRDELLLVYANDLTKALLSEFRTARSDRNVGEPANGDDEKVGATVAL